MERDITMTLAPTCSTCKLALFGRGDWRWGGKKQIGLCLANCDVPVPPPAQEPFRVVIPYRRGECNGLAAAARRGITITRELYVYLGVQQQMEWCASVEASARAAVETAGKDWDEARAKQDMADAEGRRATWTIVHDYTREQYIEHKKAYLIHAIASQKTSEELRRALRDAYDAWKKNYDWWQENWPRTRACHRALCCPAYEFVGGNRENVARAIAAEQGVGKYLPSRKE